MLATALVFTCLLAYDHGRRVQRKIDQALGTLYEEDQTSLEDNIASLDPHSSNLQLRLPIPSTLLATLLTPLLNSFAAEWQVSGRRSQRLTPRNSKRSSKTSSTSALMPMRSTDPDPSPFPLVMHVTAMNTDDKMIMRRSILVAALSSSLLATRALSITLPNLQIDSSTIFSKHLQEYGTRTKASPPCVIFFPGDLSDLANDMLPQLQQYCLEAVHNVIAKRFPEYDVITIRGELDRQKFRTFNNFEIDPSKAVDYLERLLENMRGTDANFKLVLVGFSRGGIGVTSLIIGGESHPEFWRRVEAIHYIDAGGEDCYVQSQKPLDALAKSNRALWLNFQKTPYTGNAVNSTGRNGMIRLAKDAGLAVNVQQGSGNTLAEHMRFLSDCSFERPKDV